MSFQASIDYKDVCEVNILKLVNEAAIQVESARVRECYQYDYFIQVDLAAVNGLTLKNLLLGTPERKADLKTIANVFFRFSHRNAEGVILSNRN